MIDSSVLEYCLSDSAGGLWRRVWSMGYSVSHPKPKETAKEWINRDSGVKAIIEDLKSREA